MWHKRILARLPLLGSWVAPQSLHEGFVVDRLFSEFLSLSPVTNFILQFLHILLIDLLSFNFIRACGGADVVGRNLCYSPTYSSHLNPWHSPDQKRVEKYIKYYNYGLAVLNLPLWVITCCIIKQLNIELESYIIVTQQHHQ